jgi:hypothetical protein
MESRSIFANAQPLVANVPFARCLAQIALRLFGRNILRRVEAGEIFPDDFGRRVLLDLLGALVPCHHVSRRINHIDGVFFDLSKRMWNCSSVCCNTDSVDRSSLILKLAAKLSPSESERRLSSVPSVELKGERKTSSRVTHHALRIMRNSNLRASGRPPEAKTTSFLVRAPS